MSLVLLFEDVTESKKIEILIRVIFKVEKNLYLEVFR